jgi:hypothetical protein
MKKAPIKVKWIGPVCEHNYLCAVCWKKSAVFDANTWIMQPCWDCQKKGYKVKKLFKWWRLK